MEEDKIKNDLDRLGIKIQEITKIGQSSNHIFKVRIKNEYKIIKVPVFNDITPLSPFWQQLKDIFNLTTEIKYLQQLRLVRFLKDSSNFKVPSVEKYGEYYLMSYIEGTNIEKDEFPPYRNIASSLRKFRSSLLNYKFDGYGNLVNPLKSERSFKETLFAAMQKTIRDFWDDDQEFTQVLVSLKNDFAISNEFTLIMPDISANQFLYNKKKDKIEGIVDLDSYVIAPIEMELVVLEYVLKSGDFWSKQSFYSGSLERSRMGFRLFMYLCDPDQDISWEEFSSRPTSLS